ncbi:dTMP kinase [Fodinisporobacter ferrooxydans]|uniref:Thymidylate kinase n=1 Tax=Fodinisporobacter ferrooxydans TaxID=2901836 RepID=A0ABY4CRF9_9BACL|nr:dTMP kinase [Alicyclobacillaceae bacterium MYW30-H2]
MPGIFLTIEGPDGGGKTSQVQLLAAQLEKRGIHYIKTREPGGTAISDKIRELLLNPDSKDMDSKTEALLYAASRAQLVAEVIRPALQKGYVVICDRYMDASIAYQGALGLHHDDVRMINEFATDCLRPDRTYLLDIRPEEGLKRIQRAKRAEFCGDLDRIEQRALAYHNRVREQFLRIAKERGSQYVVLDGEQPKDIVAESIWSDFSTFLN